MAAKQPLKQTLLMHTSCQMATAMCRSGVVVETECAITRKKVVVKIEVSMLVISRIVIVAYHDSCSSISSTP